MTNTHPHYLYSDIVNSIKADKAVITAMSGLLDGTIAYATDTNEFGTYDANSNTWTWLGAGALLFVQDEGVPVGTPNTLNFVGNIVDVSISGTVARVFITGSSSVTPASSLIGVFAQDEGVPLGTGTVFNFVGGGVVASISGTVIQVVVPPEFENFWTSGTQGNYSVRAKNDSTVNALGNYAFAIGQNTVASGTYSYAQGFQSKATNVGASAEGNQTTASGANAHSEGDSSVASGASSHAEGSSTQTFGDSSHAEGQGSKAYGAASHAEGLNTVASGTYSFAANNSNHAVGHSSAVLGGMNNRILGNNSVVLGGSGTVAARDDTVYVSKLNIVKLQTGTPVANLGIDAGGNIVTGTTGGNNILLDMQVSQYSARQSGSTTIPGDDTIPQNTEGTEMMSVSITPKSTTSRLEIDVSFLGAVNPQTAIIIALFRDSDADALAVSAFYPPGGNTTFTFPLHCEVVAGSISTTTFKLRVGPSSAATAYMNGTSGGRAWGTAIKSSITVREYSA